MERLRKIENVETASREFEERIQKEVRNHIGKPLALSGGVDSGTLASFLRPTFAVNVKLPGGPKYDESRYAQTIAEHLNIPLLTVEPDPKEFDEGMQEVVKAVGEPTKHFNSFALWSMYKELADRGVKEVILADGPDESLSGYARNLIMKYLYDVKDFTAFKNYYPLIDKVLPEPSKFYAKLTDLDEGKVKPLMEGQSLIRGMNRVDMLIKREEMDSMSDGIAQSFGIKNIRPYQDNPGFDYWQFDRPDHYKIFQHEYGKYILRKVAERRIPFDLAWRKTKTGGPVYPVNKIKGWVETDGEFGKDSYLRYQEGLLRGDN